MYHSKPKAQKQSQFVATDSEWDTNEKEPWINTCLATHDKTWVFVRDDLPDSIRARLETTAHELSTSIHFIHRTDATNLLSEAGIDGQVRLLHFFSPKDVEYTIGWDALQKAILANKVHQHNNLSGKAGQVYLKDLFGWANKMKLAKLATTLGVPTLNKSVMDDFKRCMFRGLTERPEDFLRYAVDDARVLLSIHYRFVEMIRTTQVEIFGMNENDLWTAETIPMTAGALVARTFEKWLYHMAGNYRDALRFCVRKWGILNQDDKRYKSNRWAYDQCVSRYRSVADLQATTDDAALKRFLSATHSRTVLEACGVKRWASEPATETACFNALVQGGRCQNENPFQFAIGAGADIDVSGCYGESLRSLHYPIGLPKVWKWDANQHGQKLGDWLRANEKELIDGLWCVVVSGVLPFEQDLIYSKLVKAGDIHRVGAEQTETNIHADMAILRREIQNGIITSDILRCMRAVATNGEWAALRNLEVVTAVAYRRQDRRENVGEWCDTVMRATDEKTGAWFSVSLEAFIGRLVDERKRHKRVGKDLTIPENERLTSQGMDAILKLLVNTLYGDFTSRHFPIGNTIVANNITARARMGVWQLAKALGLRQTITDGGIYNPSEVPCYNRERRPGLDTLSRMWEWRDYDRGRGFCKMAETADDLDTIATEYVRKFWEPYGLTLPFQLEHKTANAFTSAAYWSKADYALQTAHGIVFAVRGKDRHKGEKRHPLFALLEGILSGQDSFPNDLTYSKGGIMSVGKWKIVQKSKGYETLQGLRPGDNLPEVEYPARFNNTHFPLQDEADFQHRRNRKKTDKGKPVAHFERFQPLGVSGVHKAMENDKLRDGRVPPRPPDLARKQGDAGEPFPANNQVNPFSLLMGV